MSVRRQLLLLIATAFFGTCAMLFSMSLTTYDDAEELTTCFVNKLSDQPVAEPVGKPLGVPVESSHLAQLARAEDEPTSIAVVDSLAMVRGPLLNAESETEESTPPILLEPPQRPASQTQAQFAANDAVKIQSVDISNNREMKLRPPLNEKLPTGLGTPRSAEATAGGQTVTAPNQDALVAQKTQPIAAFSNASFRSDQDFVPLANQSQIIKNSHVRISSNFVAFEPRGVTPLESWTDHVHATGGANESNRNAVAVVAMHSSTDPTPNSQALTVSSFSQTGSQNGLPVVLQSSQNFVLAEQPKLGAHWKDDTPVTDRRSVVIEPIVEDFSTGPTYECEPYDPYSQQHVYEGKTLNANQRPLLEIGRPWYQLGQLSPSSNLLGSHNPIEQQFIVFGDFRSGLASNSQNGNSSTLSASQINLNFDWKITNTERFHMFMSPLTKGLNSTGFLFDEDRFLNNTNANILFGYFEGDLGAMAGGITKETYPFDLPFAVGVIPLLFQNGVWMENQILGFAFTIPSRNSPRFDISNMDITFFAGYDKLLTDALPDDDSAGKISGVATFLEAWNGYVEVDYAFVEDRTFLDRGYHNIGVGYTRRFGRLVSNSTRAIFNIGQNPNGIDQTADGVLLLSENSLITGAPSTVVPYFNLFAGFDRPQSAARAIQAGGVLRNTGILFESDNLTNYPTLDPTANDTFGAALGLNLLANDFSQQLVVETAFINTMGSDLGRNAPGNQYGLGARYQLPLNNAMILRADAMYGFLDNASDIHGVRVELRHKY